MLTVGLDFGTHQTKICIEDATNPNQKTYEFFKFLDNGKTTFFLPSVVQINENGTISYGTVDEKKCKKTTTDFITDCIPDLHTPILNEIPKPVFIELLIKPVKYPYPEKPKKFPYPEKPSAFADTNDWKSKLLALKNKMLNKENANVDEWREECRKIDFNYSKILNGWQNKCDSVDYNYGRKVNEWESHCRSIEKQNDEIRQEYESEKARIQKEFENALHQYNFRRNQFHYLSINEDGKITEERFIFHYFKFALYSDEVNWLHQIDPETISIWYLTNILFLLREKYGEDIFIQIGIPCGIQKKFHIKQKEKAICTLISAYNLLENYQHHSKFLAATFEELLNKTEKTTSFSEDDISKYGVDALPEAYAGLVSLTQKKKLEKGMNLLVDIGGGTTDIAFFTITEEDLPDIHSVHSLYKGLNFIYENAASKSECSDIVAIQRMIDNTHSSFGQFEEPIFIYKSELQGVARNIIGSIKDSFIKSSSKHRLHIGKLNQAMLNRPVLFSGGGSTFKELVGKVESFSDAMRINQEMLSITTLRSEIQDDNMFSILSTAYGLSIPIENENEIKLTDISDVFNHIISEDDEKSDSGYYHGLTDY
jgi:hypothetical protein